MEIAFTINPLGLEGLGATLTSLIRNCKNPSVLNLSFFCSECTELHKGSIEKLLASEAYYQKPRYIDFDAKKEFGHLKALHGDWASYGRLLIPDYIESDTVLYLDSDLVIQVDVLELSDFDFHNHFLAAAFGGKVKYALEREFLMHTLDVSPEFDYFNAGVLLMNLAQWKLDNIQAQWKVLASQFPEELLAVDQTLLNGVCKGSFAHLPSNFNNAWCPGDSQPPDADRSILHFVGSPKPWDVFGRTLHHGYHTWKKYNSIIWRKQFNRISWNKLVRTWKIKNSILIKLKKKYFR